MKKLKFLLFLLLLLFMAACNKEENMPGDHFFNPGNDILLQKVNCEQVFTVYPSGGDDTENLLQAFADAQAAGPESVVKLTEGNFTIGSVEVHDYYGSFLGAGMGKTIINSSPDLLCSPGFDNNALAHLVKFIAGDILIANITFKIRDGYACSDETGYGGHDLNSLLVLADYSDLYRPEIRYIKAVVDNCEFIGGTDDGTGSCGSYNTGVAIWAGAAYWWLVDGNDYPLSRANFSITNCTFDNLLGSAEGCMMGTEGTLDFSNNISKNQLLGFFAGFNFGARMNFRNNTFINNTWVDIWIDDNDWGTIPYVTLIRRSFYEITANKFYPASDGMCINLTDSRPVQYPDNYLPQLFSISQNLFDLKEYCTGIYAWNSNDATIRNNRFTGSGNLGIMIDGAVPAANNLILGNSFSAASFTEAAVLLGENSHNCTVIGTGKVKVVDMGTGNKVTGMIRKPGGNYFGPLIHDNFSMLHGKQR